MTPKAQAELDRRTRIAHARYAKVLTLRAEGWKFSEIGRSMGVTGARAQQMAKKGRLIATFHPELLSVAGR